MKFKELRLLNSQELENKIIELSKERMKIDSQVAVGTVPKNPSKIREIRRTIAKILTIKNQNAQKIALSKKEEAKRNE